MIARSDGRVQPNPERWPDLAMEVTLSGEAKLA